MAGVFTENQGMSGPGVDGPVGSYVVCAVASEQYAIHSDFASELVNDTDFEPVPVPGSNPALTGLINLRGLVVPVVQLRSVLGHPTHSDRTETISRMLAQREADHVAWLDDLKRCATTGDKFTKALDPTQCAFGKWYLGVAGSSSDLRDITNGSQMGESLFARMDAPHRRIHAIAREVLDLAGQGDLPAAIAIIDRAWETDLAELKRLFKQLVDAFRDSARSTIVSISYEGSPIGLYVDSVVEVRTFSESDFEPISSLATSGSPLATECASVDGRHVFRLDPGLIVAELGVEVAA